MPIPPLHPPERGVYHVGQYTDVAGDRLMVAVASDGRRLMELPFKQDQEKEVETTLRAILDIQDPLPIRLVG